MEATSVYIKKEIEDAEYERSYQYSADGALLNQAAHEEDYTVTVNPEAVLDIKYEREEEPTSSSDQLAEFSSNVSDAPVSNDSHIVEFPQTKELLTSETPPRNVNRRKRKLRVRRRDVRHTDEESEQAALHNQVKMEPEEELSTMWNSEENNSFENTTVKIENFDDDFSPDTNCSTDGTTELTPGDEFVIETEYLEDEISPDSNHTPKSNKKKRLSKEQNTDAGSSIPVENLMSLQESEDDANHPSSNHGKKSSNDKAQPKEKTRKTWFLDVDNGLWKRRSWYEEEAKNMMQKTQEDLKQIEELSLNTSDGQKKGSYKTLLQSIEDKPGKKEENKRVVKKVFGRKRSRYEEKTEMMKRKTEEDEEFIGNLKTMFKRPNSAEHSNQSTESTSSSATSPDTGPAKKPERSALVSTSLLTLTELSELNEKRKLLNRKPIPIEEDKWKELNKKSREELEQEIFDVNGKRRLTVPRKSMYEEKTKDMTRKTQEDEELIKGLQSLRKLVSKDSKEYIQLLNETSVLSDTIKEQVENISTVEYSPAPGIPVRKLVLPTESTMSHLIPHRWETDESQGDMAVYAPVLYSNQNHPDLKEKVPQWNLRATMIAKLWRELPDHTREAYKNQCRQNKIKKEDDQKRILEEELKKHSTKKTRQSRADQSYRASVPLPRQSTGIRQSQRLISKFNSATTVTNVGNDSPERSSSPAGSDVRKSIYETKTQMLKLNSERDKAAMAKANLPVPKDGAVPSDRWPGSHYALSMQMMALKTQQEMATLAKLIPQEKVAALKSGESIKSMEENFRLVKEEEKPTTVKPPLTVYVIDNGTTIPKLNGDQRATRSPPVQKDVNLYQNSVFIVRKSRHNEEPEKSCITEDSVLMCSECGEEFMSMSELDTHKTMSHNHKPPGILTKEDTALPFIKCEPVDDDFDKVESLNDHTDVDSGGKKGKEKGKVKVLKGRKKMDKTEASTNTEICDKEIKIKTEDL